MEPELDAKYNLEAFLKSYIVLGRKFEKSHSPHDKFEVSLQVMRKIFNLKEY